MYQKYIKRILDMIFSCLFLIVLSPVMLIIAILVRIKLGGPIIFKQIRPGKDEKLFSIYKFRTMTNKTDENGKLLPDEVRLTSFGKTLRAASLDELPELFNILKGDMSFVGPRPQLVKDLVFMNERQNRRHSVMPGLTGLAQINGRNAISWETKLNYDIEYIKNINIKNDFSIFLKTFKKIFDRSDITQVNMETAEDFGDYLLRTNKISKERYFNGINKANLLIKEFKSPAKATNKLRPITEKTFLEKCKCAIRKFFSAKIIPYLILNSWRIHLYRLCGYKIGNNVFIGMRCYLDDTAPELITIEDDATISYGVFFACHGVNQEYAPIKIKKGAYIGMRANIISKNANPHKKGVVVGEKAIVGACTLVNRNIPNGATVVGVPCKIINMEN